MPEAELDPSPSQPGEWRNFVTVFDRLRPPLRPAPSDVARFRSALGPDAGRILLLGVTPELAGLGTHLVAVDNSPRMIARVWPGDTDGRRAVLADWTALPFEDGSFDAVVGDGSLNSAANQLEEVLAEAARLLRPGGKAAFRCFCSPEAPEPLEAIARDVDASGNVHALKWRIAVAIAAGWPGRVVRVSEILASFNSLVPDRAALAAKTGWSLDEIATLDAYDGADHSLGFPTVGDLLERARNLFRAGSVVRSEGYPLADRCPLIVWEA